MKKALIMISVLSTVLCACDDLEFNGDILDMDGNPIVVTDQDEKCTETKTECDQNNNLITCVKDKAPELTPCGKDSTCGEDPDNPDTYTCLDKQYVCTEDKTKCEGKTLITCVEGKPKENKECPVKCGADPDKAGSFKCLEDEQPTLCTDNGTSCGENNTLVTCVKDQEPVSKPCNANQTCGKDPKNTDAYKCIDNEQIPDCTEDKTECSGNNLITCMKGQKPHTEACGDDKTCGQDSKKEGAFKCNDNAPKTCTEGNTRCGENNTLFTCLEGTEIPTPCGNDKICGQDSKKEGAFKCNDNAPKTCTVGNTRCGENNTLITCPEGTEMPIPCGDQTCGQDSDDGKFKCIDNEPQKTCENGKTWCDESTNSLHICKDGKDIETDCYDNTCGEDPKTPGTYACLSCLPDFDSYKLKEAHKCICDALKYDAIQDKNQCNAWGVVISSQNINSLQESLKQNLCSDIKYIKLKGSIQFPTESGKAAFLNNCKSLENTVLIGKDATIKSYPRYPMFEEIKNNSKIHNLKINLTKDNTNAQGIIAKKIDSSTINNVHFTGDFTTNASESVGGLFGTIENSSNIENVSFTGTLTASNAQKDIGGIAGNIKNSTITDAHFHGKLEAKQAEIDKNGGGNVGGIAGSAEGTSFQNIYVRGKTDSGTGAEILTETGGDVGGLIGEMKGGNITNTCPTNNSKLALITGTRNIGGAIGTVNNDNVKTAIKGVGINVAEIRTNNREDKCNGGCCECVIGGFIGYAQYANIENCAVKAKNISGDSYVGGFAGEIDLHATDSIININNNSGTITTSSDKNIGGFIGYMNLTGSSDNPKQPHISQINSYINDIKVNGHDDSAAMGGFIGLLAGTNGYDFEFKEVSSMAKRIETWNDGEAGGFIGTITATNKKINIHDIFTAARVCSYNNKNECVDKTGGVIYKLDINNINQNSLSLIKIISTSYRYTTKDTIDIAGMYKYVIGVMKEYKAQDTIKKLDNGSKVYYYAFHDNDSYPYNKYNLSLNYITKFSTSLSDNWDEGSMTTDNVMDHLDKQLWKSKCLDKDNWTITDNDKCSIIVPYPALNLTCTISDN
ncbi:MAG: hypothetical protein IJM59_00485 [Proteobacteria bacterium]|nr:hypothetical protein [Pseudomonadota bacterium]